MLDKSILILGIASLTLGVFSAYFDKSFKKWEDKFYKDNPKLGPKSSFIKFGDMIELLSNIKLIIVGLFLIVVYLAFK